jgi:hypothetical protein
MSRPLIWRGDDPLRLPHDRLPTLGDAVTVTAWCRSDHTRAEGLQPLISQWAPRSAFDAFSAHDASCTDGLDTRGFYGALFDGQYIYYCPIRHREDRTSVHGCVLRYDTHQPFASSAAYSAYDAGNTDDLNTRGYYGSAFDGRFLYFIPRDDGHVHHSRFLRYDTHGDFKNPASWRAHDAGHPHSFQGAAFDGRYLYCCPGYTRPATAPFSDAEACGVVMRLDTVSDFNDPASYRTFDASTIDSRAVCFDGAAFDSRYVYFVPLETGTILRYDTAADFDDAESWKSFDGGAIGVGTSVGAVYDGRFLYLVPFGHGRVVRCDTRGNFSDRATWQVHDAGMTPGIGPTGYKGGFFDGRFLYFVPFRGPVAEGTHRSPYHGAYLRYDTTQPFSDTASWSARDAGCTDGLATTAFTAGASDGRYLYAAPWRGDLDDGCMHGRILRYDTLGENASFSLRYADYGHNGGLCAALPGPSFLINTSRGPFSVGAHHALTPGWHHLAGVYDGARIALFIDGVCVAERAARGMLLGNKVDVTVGHIGSARFEGRIGEASVEEVARSHDWVQRQHAALATGRPS